MWRALFLAFGLTTFIVGVECLAIDKAVLTTPDQRMVSFGQSASQPPREVIPPEWAPWSLLSVGAVVVLYSFTIPKRVNNA